MKISESGEQPMKFSGFCSNDKGIYGSFPWLILFLVANTGWLTNAYSRKVAHEVLKCVWLKAKLQLNRLSIQRILLGLFPVRGIWALIQDLWTPWEWLEIHQSRTLLPQKPRKTGKSQAVLCSVSKFLGVLTQNPTGISLPTHWKYNHVAAWSVQGIWEPLLPCF